MERARAHAERLMRGEGREAEAEPGWLGGLPVAIKDLADVAGVRTTYGSPIFRDHVPTRSHPVVERIERKGGVIIAKSNTPEFGAGGSTFNEVFGRTRNPWNTALTSGGSTGGGAAALAAALAAGEVWLAHGSDHPGSLLEMVQWQRRDRNSVIHSNYSANVTNVSICVDSLTILQSEFVGLSETAMPDLASKSKHYRDRAAEYLAFAKTTKLEYVEQLCRTIADHFMALADAEDRFIAEQVRFWQRFRAG